MIEDAGMEREKISNKIKNKNWENTIKQYKLDPTLNWKLAEIIFG